MGLKNEAKEGKMNRMSGRSLLYFVLRPWKTGEGKRYKKSVSIFVLFVYVLFTISCSIPSLKMLPIGKIKPGKLKKIETLGPEDMSGERVEFHQTSPGAIIKNKIVGNVYINGEPTFFSIFFSKALRLQIEKLSIEAFLGIFLATLL
jgi:hypothetical protein